MSANNDNLAFDWNADNDSEDTSPTDMDSDSDSDISSDQAAEAAVDQLLLEDRQFRSELLFISTHGQDHDDPAPVGSFVSTLVGKPRFAELKAICLKADGATAQVHEICKDGFATSFEGMAAIMEGSIAVTTAPVVDGVPTVQKILSSMQRITCWRISIDDDDDIILDRLWSHPDLFPPPVICCAGSNSEGIENLEIQPRIWQLRIYDDAPPAACTRGKRVRCPRPHRAK